MELCCLGLGIEAGSIDSHDLLQITAHAGQDIAVCIKEFDAQGAGKAHAAVIGCRTADGDGNICKSCVEHGIYQLAGAVGGGVKRVAFVCRDHGKA